MCVNLLFEINFIKLIERSHQKECIKAGEYPRKTSNKH